MTDYNNEKRDNPPADSMESLSTIVLPIVLLVDTSASIIKSDAINELNRVLQEFYSVFRVGDKSVDGNAEKLIEFSVISFGSDVNIKFDFQPVDVCRAPWFLSDESTSMNQALIFTLSDIRERKRLYKSSGVRYYRTWLFVLTNGLAVNDIYEIEAIHKVREAILKREIKYMPVGVGSADIKQLKKYYPESTEWKMVLIEPNEYIIKNVLNNYSIEDEYYLNSDLTSLLQLSEPPLKITVGI